MTANEGDPNAAPSVPKGRVLLVDDDPSLLAALERQLRKRFDITTAAGGKQALEFIAKGDDFAVIVSDLQMPGLSGLRFLAQAREKLPDMVPVILSGKASLDLALDALNEGRIFRFLTKPCDSNVLSAAIDAAIERHAANLAERSLLDSMGGGAVEALRTVKEQAQKAERTFTELANRSIKAIASEAAPSAEAFLNDSAQITTDPESGLPDWSSAQRAISAMLKADYNVHLAMFHISRFEFTCSRYGAAIGTQILLICSQHAASDISPNLPVFRWKGPVLLALIVSNESPATIRNAVHSFASINRHQYFQTPTRTVYLPVHMSAEVITLRGFDPVEVFSQIEQFGKQNEDSARLSQPWRSTIL